MENVNVAESRVNGCSLDHPFNFHVNLNFSKIKSLGGKFHKDTHACLCVYVYIYTYN